MSGTLSKAWWLLALCGILDAMYAGANLLTMNLVMRPLIFRGFGSPSDAVWDMGLLALSAGACATAAGLWSGGRGHSWLLGIHGLALVAFGAIIVSPLGKGPLSFRPVSLLFTVMAASIGAFALETPKAQRRGAIETWLLIAAGTASIAFAFSFIVVGFVRIIGQLITKPPISFYWMSSYFVLCAVLMLWLAFRADSGGASQSGQTGPLSVAPIPTHAP